MPDLQSQYRGKIDPVLEKLLRYAKQKEQPSVEQLERTQAVLDHIAATFQYQEELAEDLYKLYLCQSLLHHYASKHHDAHAFLREAKKHDVNADTRFVEGLLGQTPDSSGGYASIEHVDIALAVAKKSGKKSILIGLGLIVAGLIITIISYNMADTGDSFFVFWGLSVFGLIVLFKGIYAYTNPASQLDKELAKRHPNLSRKGFGVFMGIIGCIGAVVISLVSVGIFSPTLINDVEGYTIENYESNFITYCVDGGGDSAACTCAAKYMTSHYSLDHLKEIDEASDPNETTIHPDLQQAIDACI